MRDSPGTRTFTRPRALTSLLMATSVAGGCLVLPAGGLAAAKPAKKQAFQGSTKVKLSLKSRVRVRLKRAQAAGDVLPLTLRLRRSYEGGPGDDVVAFDWDTGATPWPLAGTLPAPTEALTHLDGALSYQWDYSADTSGYATMGTVETNVGGGIALTGTGFPIAVPEGSTCTTLASLDATGISLTSAGARFGTLNPFTGEVSGTMSVRTAIRTRAVPCGGDPATAPTAVARTAAPDPPLPVAFTGRFSMSPSITADGRIRVGLLRVSDADIPQRTTFGLVHACADPLAADGCDRRAFPVRTRVVSLTAEVLMGDVLPAAPGDPPEPSSATPSTTAPANLSPSVQPSV
jgi:hypothetical protein